MLPGSRVADDLACHLDRFWGARNDGPLPGWHKRSCPCRSRRFATASERPIDAFDSPGEKERRQLGQRSGRGRVGGRRPGRAACWTRPAKQTSTRPASLAARASQPCRRLPAMRTATRWPPSSWERPAPNADSVRAPSACRLRGRLRRRSPGGSQRRDVGEAVGTLPSGILVGSTRSVKSSSSLPAACSNPAVSPTSVPWRSRRALAPSQRGYGFRCRRPSR